MNSVSTYLMQSVHAPQVYTPTSDPLEAGPVRWYAIYTRCNREKLVRDTLLYKHVDTFLPVREILSRWKDRRHRIQVPLFPGYLFVHVNLAERKLDIAKVSGIVRIIGFTYPEPIPAAEIDAVRRFVDTTVKYDPYPYLTEGRHVEVRSGPLCGLRGILVRKKNKFKFVLSVHLIRQSVALEIDACDVEPTG